VTLSPQTRRHTPTALVALLFVIATAIPVKAQYGGPSILSRGGNAPGRRGNAPVSFTAYVGGGSRYESGLIAVSSANQSSDDVGGSVEAGLYGGHNWKRSTFGIDYRGDYRKQVQQTVFNGTNQLVSVEYGSQVARRIYVSVQATGGTTNRAFGGFAAPAFANNSRQGIPLSELFDVRTYFGQVATSVSWTPNARIAASASIQGFFVKRENFSLINSQGYTATGQVKRRLNRRTSVGAEYQFTRFEFPRVFAATDIQSLSGTFEHLVGRSLRLTGSIGAMGVWSSGTELVALSQEVAAFLGRTSNLVAFQRSSLHPRFDGGATYLFRRASLTGSASSGAGAGNGAFLATKQTTVNGGYSYAGIRRMSIGLSAGMSKTESLSLVLDAFNSWQTGVGASYHIAEGLNLTTQLDYRTFSTMNMPGRSGVAFGFSLAYSTSRLPLSIW